MALSDLDKLFVYDYSMQLLQQDMLTNAYFQGSKVGESLRSMVLPKSTYKIFSNPYEEALSGTMRSDAATLRAASKNVSEAASIYDTAAGATGTIKESLTRMLEIAEGVKEGTYAVGDVSAEYDQLVSQINGAVEGAAYNGMFLLDKDQWTGEERITVNGDVGNISIHAGNSSFDIAFNDLSTLIGADFDASGDLTADVDAVISGVTTALSTVTAHDDAYASQSSLLSSQATSLTNQADVLDKVVETRTTTSTSQSLESILLDYILQNSGRLLDSSS